MRLLPPAVSSVVSLVLPVAGGGLAMADARAALKAWQDAVNAHDVDAIAGTLTDDFHWQLWEATTTGPAASREAWRLLFEGIPDWRMEPIETIVEGARCAVRWSMSGTHTGPLRFRGTKSMDHPLSPTGRTFRVEGASIHEFREGRMSVNRAYWRPDQMLLQLGLSTGR